MMLKLKMRSIFCAAVILFAAVAAPTACVAVAQPAAMGFAGKARAGCGQPTDRACWQSAVRASVAACRASGCQTCSESKSAGDSCAFQNGYTCTSYCAKP